MKSRSALLLLALLVLSTTALEFSGWRWAGVTALLVTIGLCLYWLKRGAGRYAVYAAVLLSIFPEMQTTTLSGLQLHHVLALAAAVCAFVPWIVLRPWPLPRLSKLLALYFGVSVLLAVTHYQDIQSWHRVFVVALFILLALVIPHLLTTRRHLIELAAVVTGGTVVSVLIGLAAYYYASVTHTLFTNPYLHISTVEGVPRLAGTFLDSNFLGHQLILVLPLLLAVAWYKRGLLQRWDRTGLYFVTALLMAALALTYSRSAYIGFATAAIVLLITLRRKLWKTLLTSLIAGAALATVLVPNFPFFSIYRFPSSIIPTETKEQLLLGFNPRALVDEYIRSVQNDPTLSEEEREQILARDVSSESLGYRLEYWQAGIEMFKDHPVRGVGLGQFRHRFSEYSDLRFVQQPDTHNIFVETLAESGLIGITLLLSLIVYTFMTLIRAMRYSDEQRLPAAILLSAFMGLLAQSLLLGGLGVLPIYLVVGVAATFSPRTVLLGRPRRGRKAKRIVYITATTEKDSPGNVLYNLISHLDRSHYEPIVITILRGGPWDREYHKLKVRRINLRLFKPLDVVAPFILWPILYVLRPDLVQTQMIRGDVYGRWAAMRVGSAFVSVIHNMDIWKHTRRRFHRFATWWDAQSLAQARAIVTVSEAVKRDIVQRQGIEASKVTVIRNAISADKFSAKVSASELTQLRKSFKLTPNAQVVLTTARLHAQKAPEVWVVAATRVVAKNPNAVFIWAGDGPMLAATRAMVPPEYRTRIKLIGHRTDVPKLLKLADVFVLPSRFEGLPVSLIEAMAAGSACVATRVSGNPELVEHNVSGLLVPPNRAQELASAIQRLLRDPGLRARLGRQAKIFVEGHFTSAHMVAAYDRFYRNLLDPR